MYLITNNQPRDLLGFSELTKNEQAEFDYIDPSKDDVHNKRFFRYKGEVYDSWEFRPASEIKFPDWWDGPNKNWDGIHNDTFFSGILIRFTNDSEQVIVGRYYT